MKRVNAKIHRHWQGEARYSLELELRPEYVAAAVDVHVDGQGLIQRLAVNSASFGSAVWQAGKGLVASYRWESDDEAATAGAWNGLLTAHGARRSGSQNAYRAAADALSKLPLQVGRWLLLDFIARGDAAPCKLAPAVAAEFESAAGA